MAAFVLHSRHRVYQHHETEEEEGKGTGPRKSELGTQFKLKAVVLISVYRVNAGTLSEPSNIPPFQIISSGSKGHY